MSRLRYSIVCWNFYARYWLILISSCSLKCNKTHKAESHCTGTKPSSNLVQPPAAVSEPPASSSSSRFEKLLQDPQIQYYLSHESLKVHLRAVYEILNNPQLSGEQTSDGRRSVALKKLRELRVGGIESNELVEEFVCRVLDLLDEDEMNS